MPKRAQEPLTFEVYLRRELPAFRRQLGLATYAKSYTDHLVRGAELFIDHLIGKPPELGQSDQKSE